MATDCVHTSILRRWLWVQETRKGSSHLPRERVTLICLWIQRDFSSVFFNTNTLPIKLIHTDDKNDHECWRCLLSSAAFFGRSRSSFESFGFKEMQASLGKWGRDTKRAIPCDHYSGCISCKPVAPCEGKSSIQQQHFENQFIDC